MKKFVTTKQLNNYLNCWHDLFGTPKDWFELMTIYENVPESLDTQLIRMIEDIKDLEII